MSALQAELVVIQSDLASKKAAVEQVINSAVKAGKIKPLVESYLRGLLARVTERKAAPSAELLPSLATDFEKNADWSELGVAWENLRSELRNREKRVREISAEAYKLLLQRVLETTNSATKVEDFAPLRELLTKFAEPSESLPPPSMAFWRGERTVSSLQRLVEQLQKALALMEAHDLTQLCATMQFIYDTFNPTFKESAAWTALRERLVKPFVDEGLASKRGLEAEIMARKPVDELTSRLQELIELNGRLKALETGQRSTSFASLGVDESVNSYRSIIAVLGGLQTGDSSAARVQNLSTTGAKFALGQPFREFLVKLTQELRDLEAQKAAQAQEKARAAQAEQEARSRAAEMEREEKMREEGLQRSMAFTAKVRQKLGEVRSAASAMALADQLPSMVPASGRSEYRDGMENMQLGLLQQQLRALAASWQNGTLGLENSPELLQNDPNGLSAFTMDLTAVRERAARQVLAARWSAPELLRPPLLEKPLRAAVQDLVNQAAKRSDWKRAYLLLTPAYRTVDYGGTPQWRGIRAYLTGQNFEAAEQFAAAAAAYQQVLEEIADVVPLAEASARLKALRQTHPEAFSNSATLPGKSAPASVYPLPLRR